MKTEKPALSTLNRLQKVAGAACSSRPVNKRDSLTSSNIAIIKREQKE